MESLGEFTIEGVLGEGGSAVVYTARRRDEVLALKVPRPEVALSEREVAGFVAEAQRAQRVAHPSLIAILGAGILPDGRPYLAMPRLHGEALAERIARGPMPLDTALRLFRGLAEALDALHGAGLVHRDIKPENVFVVGDDERLVLLDLGIARDIHAPASTTTQAGLVRGTPAYMAPERFFGARASTLTDTYEAAVVLYAMLTGRLPWDQGQEARGRMSPQDPRAFVPVPELIAEALLRALSVDETRRPQGPRALLMELEQAAISGADTTLLVAKAGAAGGPRDAGGAALGAGATRGDADGAASAGATRGAADGAASAGAMRGAADGAASAERSDGLGAASADRSGGLGAASAKVVAAVSIAPAAPTLPSPGGARAAAQSDFVTQDTVALSTARFPRRRSSRALTALAAVLLVGMGVAAGSFLTRSGAHGSGSEGATTTANGAPSSGSATSLASAGPSTAAPRSADAPPANASDAPASASGAPSASASEAPSAGPDAPSASASDAPSASDAASGSHGATAASRGRSLPVLSAKENEPPAAHSSASQGAAHGTTPRPGGPPNLMDCFMLQSLVCGPDYRAIDAGTACNEASRQNLKSQLRPKDEWNAIDVACKGELQRAMAAISVQKRQQRATQP